MDIIVETPKGSTNKYTFVQHGLYRMKKMLAPGLRFPYPFGFIPGTLGEDGDPLDVLVLGEFEGFPGCLVDCRLIGCLVAEQGKKGKIIRNDRYLVIPEISREFAHVRDVSDVDPIIIDNIKKFFYDYMGAEGKHFEIIETLNADAAGKLLAAVARL